MDSDAKKTMSIVVTTYSNARLQDTFDLLDSIRRQTYLDFEVVLVVEGSRSMYNDIASYLDDTYPLTRLFFRSESLGLSAARNFGAKVSQGDIIAFVDDDAVLSPNWADQVVKSFEDPSIVAVTGPALPLWEDKTMAWLPEELYWIIGCTSWCGWTQLRTVRNAWGMNMSFKREAFESAGGFSIDMGGIKGRRLHGEETEFSLRVIQKTGKKIVYNPCTAVGHKVPSRRLTTRAIIKTSFWMGYTRRQLQTLFPKKNKTEDVLQPEHELLRNMAVNLFPNMLKTFFRNPFVACRIVCVTQLALLTVIIGYLSGMSAAKSGFK
jgi:GT2 family glycosyltransferase